MRDYDDNVTDFRPKANRRRPPLINLPPVTGGLLLLLLVIFVADMALSVVMGGHRIIASYLAFYGLSGDPFSFVQLLTFALIHHNFSHLIMNGLALAILGKVLEPVVGPARLLITIFVSSSAGAIAQSLFSGESILVGISAGIGGLFGLAMPPAKAHYFGRFDQPILILGAFFIISSLIGLALPILGNIAHIAHLAGFLTGLLFSKQFIPQRRGW